MANVDWGRSGRRDAYSFHLVDPFTLQETGELLEADPYQSSITWGWETDNTYSGSIRTITSTTRDRLVRVRQSINVGGQSHSVTLGTFFIDETPTSALYGRVSRNLTAYSTMWRYTQDVLAKDFVRAKGYNVVQAIRDLVEEEGGLLLVEPGVNTAKTFGNPIWQEIGQNKAAIIRKIASWIDCVVYSDADGYVVLAPYTAPEDKAVRYEFESGRNCVYVPGIEISDSSASAVNRVVAWWSRSSIPKTARKNADGSYVKDDAGETVYDLDDDYGLSDCVTVDLPYHHAFSFERVGRRRTYVMKLTEACSHADLEAKATAYLNENCGSTRYYEIEHVSVPEIAVGDVVRYVNPHDYSEPIDCKCLVTEISMSLTPGGLCKTKLREVGT